MDEGKLKKEATKKVETWKKYGDMQWEKGNPKIEGKSP